VPQLLWDASALAKGYAPELGKDTVRALLATAPAVAMITTSLGYTETYASLRRKFNGGVFDAAAYDAARSLLRLEVLIRPDFRLMTLDDEAILGGIPFIDQHNLNASDAAVLYTFVRYARAQSLADPVCVLLAADQRLIRASESEGLKTLNPEVVSPADVRAVLAAL
jgi:predicted nucleic acid-binding protein